MRLAHAGMCVAFSLLVVSEASCSAAAAPVLDSTANSAGAPLATVDPPAPSATSASSALPTSTRAFVASPSPGPAVERLAATVTASLLSCRYGPGASYLFLYGLRKGANIKLIGRTDGDNWHWAYVDGANKCWVNASFIEIKGELSSLPVVYPGIAKLPVSPYYPPTSVLSAVRAGNQVTVEWTDIPLRLGDEEDARMQHYVMEVWRCEGGHLLFEPLATNNLSATFIDESGCAGPSHGRIFVQEKHGFAGPTEIPWPQAN